MLKRPVKEKGRPPVRGGGRKTPPIKHYNLLNGAPSLHRGMRRMRFNLNKILPVMNELK